MTDDTGMLQHAIFSVPNTREGYTTDDNARALIVSTLLNERQGIEFHEERLNRSRRYLAFLWLAFHSDTGRFRNFLGYDRQMAGGRWLGRQPWPRLMGSGHCAWPFAGRWIAGSGRKTL